MPTLREMSGLAEVCPMSYALMIVRMLRSQYQGEPATFEGVLAGIEAVEQRYGSIDDPANLNAWLDDLGPELDIDMPEEFWDECDTADLSEETQAAVNRMMENCPATNEQELNAWMIATMQNMKSDPNVRAALEARLKDFYSQHGVDAPSVDSLPEPVLAPKRKPQQGSKGRTRHRRRRRKRAINCALAAAPVVQTPEKTRKQELSREVAQERIKQAMQEPLLTEDGYIDLNEMVERVVWALQPFQKAGHPVNKDREDIKRSLRRRFEADGYYIGADDRIHYRRWSWRRGFRQCWAVIAGAWGAVTARLLFWR